MTLQDALDELKKMTNTEDRIDWFEQKRSGIFNLFVDAWEQSKQQCENVIEDFSRLFPKHVGKIKKQITNAIKSILDNRLRERIKDHGDIQLIKTKDDLILPTQPNLVNILTNSKHLPLVYDEHSGHPYYEVYGDNKLPWPNDVRDGWIEFNYPVPHREKDVQAIRYYDVYSAYQFSCLKSYLNNFFPEEIRWTALKDAITEASMNKRINMQQDYYRNGLPDHDDKDRYDYMCRYMGVVDKRWGRIVGKHLVLSVIARAFHPGYDYRGIVVLLGPENSGKTRFCKLLAFHPHFYSYLFLDSRHEGYETARKMQGMAVIELMEGGNIMSKSNDYSKVLLSSTFDINRRMHSNTVDHNLRSGIMIMTANHLEVSNMDANTRYIIVECPEETIDIEALEAEMPQILAQALADWRNEVTPRLTDDEWKLQQTVVRGHEIVGDLYYPIIGQLKDRVKEIMQDGIKVNDVVNWLNGEFDKDHWFGKKNRNQIEKEIRAVLKKLKFKSETKHIEGTKKDAYRCWVYKGEKAFGDYLQMILDQRD